MRSPDVRIAVLYEVTTRVANVAQALSRILLETLPQQAADISRRGVRQRLPVRLAFEDPRHRVGHGIAREDGAAGEYLEQHATERPDVRPLVHHLAPRLLRAHVGRRPEDHPFPCAADGREGWRAREVGSGPVAGRRL